MLVRATARWNLLHKCDFLFSLIGWGKIRHPGSSHPVLQQALLPVINSSYCQHKVDLGPSWQRLNITHNMVCAGEEGSIKSGCHGDSGGPFVCPDGKGLWVLEGAVSWGSYRCDALDRFTVFTRISHLRRWIDQQIK